MKAGTDSLQIARFLKQVQDDTAALETKTDMPRDLGPAYLRSRAAHFRALARQQPDSNRAKLFNDLATSFEDYASIKEQGPASHEG